MDDDEFFIIESENDEYVKFMDQFSKKIAQEDIIKINGKILNENPQIKILFFHILLYEDSQYNPFENEILISIEFTPEKTPYVQLLSNLIYPTLFDCRNYYYCLSSKDKYKFSFNDLCECEKILMEIINNIYNFLVYVKDNVKLNIFIFFGEYELNNDYSYRMNDFLKNQEKINFFRIYEIEESEEGKILKIEKYIICTEIYFMILKPEKDDKTLAKIENYYRLLDINLSFNEKNLEVDDDKNKKAKNLIVTVKLCQNNNINENNNCCINEGKKILDFIFINKADDNSLGLCTYEYDCFKELVKKKVDFELKNFNLIIFTYRNLFFRENDSCLLDCSEDEINFQCNEFHKLIDYNERLYNLYKDNKKGLDKNRKYILIDNITYFCTEIIAYYSNEQQDVSSYMKKLKYYIQLGDSIKNNEKEKK